MKILLIGATGGIGTAIKKALESHEIFDTPQRMVCAYEEIDWIIFSHGFLGEENVEETFNVNTLLCINLTKSLLRFVKKGVIYISSTAALTANSMFPVYSASKAALNTYSKAMAKKHKELQFYALCPGPTDTKMWRSLNLEGKAQDPKEVAKVVQQILDGKFTSGDIITVRDGEIAVCS